MHPLDSTPKRCSSGYRRESQQLGVELSRIFHAVVVDVLGYAK